MFAFLAALWLTRPAYAQDTWFVDDSQNDGLVAHWRFDETVGTFTRDFVGTAHGTASASGGLVLGPVPPVDYANPGSFRADATRFITVTETLSTNLSSGFTLAGWVQRDSTGQYHAIYDSGEQNNEWWVFISGATSGGLNDNRLGFAERGVTPERYSDVTFPSDGLYHHIAVVKNGDGANNITFYIDGIARGTASAGSVTTPSGPRHIGALFDPSVAPAPFVIFDGHMDDLRLYNRALTTDEIGRLAQGDGCVTDGASWPQAFRDLNCSLDSAASGDEILVAKGLYYPGTYLFSTFDLRNGLSIFGGYQGNEGSPLPRPILNPAAPAADLTILSGDLDRNDSLTAPDFATYGGNTRRVTHLSAGTSTHLQGVQVRGGSATEENTLFANGAGMRTFAGVNATLVNVSFFANQAEGRGGGLYATGPVRISDSHFQRNRVADTGFVDGVIGGAIAVTDTLEITASTFISNFAFLDGGAIHTTAPMTVHDSIFIGNEADTFFGGAVRADSKVFIESSAFERNVAGFNGGALYLDSNGAASRIVESTFTNNRVGSFLGGAIESFDDLTVVASTFTGNQAEDGGGAINMTGEPTRTLVVSATTFVQNRALGANCPPQPCTDGKGGAIRSRSNVSIEESHFIENTAIQGGGALFVQASDDPAIISSSWFTDNIGGSQNDADPNIAHGGAILSRIPLIIADSRFTNNRADEEGGAIYLTEIVGLDLQRSDFVENSATSGGAIRVTPVLDGTLSASVFVVDSSFVGNNATGNLGGALYTEAPSEISGSEFVSNASANEGGAVVSLAPIQVSRSQFVGNRAPLSSALVVDLPNDLAVDHKQVVVQNNLFAGNEATNAPVGGDIRLFDVALTLQHNTFANPAGAARVGQLVRTEAELTNNILFNYASNAQSPFSITDNSTLNEDHNLYFPAAPVATAGLTLGASSLVTEPLFVDANGGDFHLSVASPARNRALASAINVDFDGDARPIGPAPDMGYDEARFVAPVANAGGPYSVNEAAQLSLDASLSSDGDNAITSYAWDCNEDSLFDAVTGVPTGSFCVYPDNGTKNLFLSVSDATSLFAADTVSVTINNVAPLVTTPGNQSATEGVSAAFALGSFSDPGPDNPWNVTVDWGDGTVPTTFNLAAAGALGSQNHAYATAGSKLVTVSVRDKDNGQTSVQFTITVADSQTPTPTPPPNVQYLPAIQKP